MFQKGNKYAAGKKSGGRKTKKEEFKEAIQEIKQEELIKLANTKVYRQLKEIESFKDTKEMALPITLKGIIEKKDITSGGKPFPILGGITQQNDLHKDDSSRKTAETDKAD